MKSFFAFKASANADTTDLNLYDEIGFWGDSAKSFHAQLKEVKTSKISLHINSPGGSVVDGFAIYNMLRAHDAEVTTYVDGIAASIASIIAMAGEKIIMPENALMMIHDPGVGMFGNADELRKTAEELDKIKESLVAIYVAKSGLDAKRVSKLMQSESLLSAKECLTLGLADEVLPENRVAALFKAADYFTDERAVLVAAAFTKTIPPEHSASGGQKETQIQPINTMAKFTKVEDANARVDELEAAQTINATAHATALKDAKTTAHQDATNAAKTAEKTRKDGIKALADKYNKDGDLNAITVTALAADTTVDAFREQVMDIIQARPAGKALRQVTTSDKGASGTKVETVEDFVEIYKSTKSNAVRQKLVRDHKVLARAAMQAGSVE